MDRFTAFEGNVTAEPEVKTFDDGNTTVRFRLLNNPQYLDRNTGETVRATPVGMTCSTRGHMARKIAQHAHKGDRLLVWGSLKAREYTDKSTGQTRTIEYLDVEAAGDSFRFRQDTTAAQPAAAQQDAPVEDWPETAQPGSGA